ncbi:MAG: phosphoribosyl-ATP pyrophosphatase [Sphingomonas bacterium]|nr:phosphoribosyl-ATP pyrophosphatase [Sphingomonas bacterium]
MTLRPGSGSKTCVNDDILDRLQATISARRGSESGYTAQLFARGRGRIAQKLGEEAIETVIAACGADPAAIVPEAADLVYHLLVLLADAGLTLDDVRAELQRREGIGGLVEKSQRAEQP